jgi:acyl carrier protein
MAVDSVSDIAHKLITQVATASGADAVALSLNTTLQEVGLDSVLLALVLRAIEAEFSLEFQDDEVSDFLGASTIGDYVDIVIAAMNHRDQSRDGAMVMRDERKLI